MRPFKKEKAKTRRLCRRIIYDSLPGTFTGQNKIDVTFKVEVRSSEMWGELVEKCFTRGFYLSFARSYNDNHKSQKKIFSKFNGLMKEKDKIVEQIIQKAIGETGIKEEQMLLALETLKAAEVIMSIEVPKQKSVNPSTPKAQHDLIVGRLLMNEGVSRKRTAIILAKIREIDPLRGMLSPVLNINREAKSIEQRLRNKGM